jgi:hypothetical protein
MLARRYIAPAQTVSMTKTMPLITRRSLAIPCDSGKYGSARRICASDSNNKPAIAMPPDITIESTRQPSRNRFNRS